MPRKQLVQLKHHMDALGLIVQFLRLEKNKLPNFFNQDAVDALEKKIVNIFETFRKRRQPQAAIRGVPPVPQTPTKEKPVQQLDQVNMAGGFAQAPHEPPSRMVRYNMGILLNLQLNVQYASM